MINTSIGQIRDNFYITGFAACPIFLLDAPKPALFDGGTTCAGRLYVDAIRSILGDRKPEILFLTHMHWDHCGAVSYLKEAYPDLKIAASPVGAKILQNPKASALMARLNQDIRSDQNNFSDVDLTKLINDTFSPFSVDIYLKDGQYFDLGGGITVQALATPGHTRDHFSYYLPADKTLVAGEACGELDSSGSILTHFLVDYESYMYNLQRLASLSAEILCQGHQFAFIGREEVQAFFERSRSESIRYKERICELLDEQDGCIESVIQKLKAERYDTIIGPKQPEIPYLLNTTAQVRHLASKIIPRGSNKISY